MTEPPIVVANRKELSYLLCQAAELEHALMCEYLYAAFSIKQQADETLPDEHVGTVERWRSVLLRVAAEEMLHWALVNNLLTAVGSAPFVSRPHFPHQAKGYPAGVQLALLRFDERSLRHFLYLERPEGLEVQDAEGFEAVGPALPVMTEGDIIPWGQDFGTVGHLYRSIEAGLIRLAGSLGEDGLFIGPQRAQASPASFGWPELVPLHDLASARNAVDRIVTQGEGARGDWSDAHYGRFLAVLDEYLALKADNPTFEPAQPCFVGGVRPVDGVVPERFITDPATAAATDLFNATYDLILQMIVRFFAFGEETDAELTLLARGSVGLMFGAIEPVGMLLASMPLGPDHPGLTAGANFQLPYRSNFLLPHKRSAWIRFSERLDELAGFAEGIETSVEGKGVLHRTAGVMRDLLVRLSAHVE